MPASWTTGIVPFGRTMPYAPPAPASDSMHGQLAYALDANLVDWAYHLTAPSGRGSGA
jgi:purine nucleoside permease